jgi:hypothetical protein
MIFPTKSLCPFLFSTCKLFFIKIRDDLSAVAHPGVWMVKKDLSQCFVEVGANSYLGRERDHKRKRQHDSMMAPINTHDSCSALSS